MKMPRSFARPPCQPRTDTQFGSSLTKFGGLIRTSAVTIRLSAAVGNLGQRDRGGGVLRHVVAQPVGGRTADDQDGQRHQADADARASAAVVTGEHHAEHRAARAGEDGDRESAIVSASGQMLVGHG